jgi:hypothetical protein
MTVDIASKIKQYGYGVRVESKSGRIGTCKGNSLGGATKRGKTKPMLQVRVKWDDGSEYNIDASALTVIE